MNDAQITSYSDRLANRLRMWLPSMPQEGRTDNLRLYELVVSGFLRLTRHAIERNREADSLNFYSQLFRHERHGSSMTHAPWRPTPEANTADLSDLLQVARIVITGWCVRHLRKRQSQDSAPKTASLTLLHRCAGTDYGLGQLIRVWRIANQGTIDSTVLDRLGVTRWESEVRRPSRPGFAEVYSPDYSWLLDGVLTLMLCQRSAPMERPSVHESAAPFWDVPKVEQRMTMLLQHSWMPISPDSAPAAFGNVLSAIDRQETAVAQRNIEHLFHAKIDDQKWVDLSKGIADHFADARRAWSNLRSKGFAPANALSCAPARTRRTWRIHKTDLAVGFSPLHGLAKILAEDAATSCDIGLVAVAEHLLEAPSAPQDTSDFSKAITAAIDDLRDTGANTLIVPDTPRIVPVLRQIADETGDTGVDWAGPPSRIHGLEVVYWPHPNPRTAIVCDSRRLFAEHEATNPTLALVSSNDDENELILEEAQRAESLSDVPDPDKLTLLVEIIVTPDLGIADISAARAVALPRKALRSPT